MASGFGGVSVRSEGLMCSTYTSRVHGATLGFVVLISACRPCRIDAMERMNRWATEAMIKHFRTPPAHRPARLPLRWRLMGHRAPSRHARPDPSPVPRTS